MTWWQRLLRRQEMEDHLEKELRFHVEQHTADLIRAGHTPEEAGRLAKLGIGGPEQVKEACRDARGTRWLDDLARDVRQALRILRRNPGFAAVVLLTLALGTGATTVLFTVVDGVLLKPLPYPQPDRLVALHGHSDTFAVQNIAYYDFLDFQRESHTLDLAGWLFSGGTISEPGSAEYVDRREISSNFPQVLGLKIFRGRAFLPEEDRAGGTPVAILGYSLWQRRFAGRADALDSRIVFEGKPYTIVGIAPPSFRLDGEPDIYTPMGQNTLGYMRSRRPHPVGVLARLGPGATYAEAQAELSVIGQHLSDQYPDTNGDRTFAVEPLRPDVGDVRSTLWLLMGAVCLVLLIACVNVASLLLARAVSRDRELAMRAALGAGRMRLVRQCLAESAVLGLLGGLLGVGLAALGVRQFVTFWPGSLPRAEEVHLDWRVLLFAVGVSLLSGLLFGLAPALRSPARNLDRVLRAGSRSVAGGSQRLHAAFVISELALAVVLLVSAGMLGHTLLHLSTLNPGVNIQNVLVTRAAVSPTILTDPSRVRAAWQDLVDHARQAPGVEAVAMVDTVPMREGNNQLGYSTTADLPPENKQPQTLATSVTADYLKVMGIPLRQGRFFNDQDRLGGKLVVVIDDVFARQAFRAEEPIGKRLWIPDMFATPVEVVGVVGHVRHWGLAGDDQAQVRAQLYYPFSQVPDNLVRRWSEVMSIAVRTSVPPLTVVESLRRQVRGDGDQVLYEVHTLEQLASDSLARQRFLLLLFGIFGGLALVLASIGIYGVLAYLTNQRVPEIGVRIALGARPGQVLWLVLNQSLRMIMGGLGLGVVAALAAASLLQRSVEGMQPTDPLTIALMISVLVAAALLASFIPARRASRIDPMTALRQD